MNLGGKTCGTVRIRKITTTRMVLAVVVAIGADALQLLLLPFAFVDSAIDLVAMLVIAWLVGFHWLLLPTFVIEFVPVIDAMPTWTACTLAVIAMRKRELKTEPLPTSAISSKPPVEI